MWHFFFISTPSFVHLFLLPWRIDGEKEERDENKVSFCSVLSSWHVSAVSIRRTFSSFIVIFSPWSEHEMNAAWQSTQNAWGRVAKKNFQPHQRRLYIRTYVSFFVHNMGNQFLIFVENGLNIIIRFFIKSLTEKMEYFSYPLKNHHSTEISTVY